MNLQIYHEIQLQLYIKRRWNQSVTFVSYTTIHILDTKHLSQLIVTATVETSLLNIQMIVTHAILQKYLLLLTSYICPESVYASQVKVLLPLRVIQP